MATCPDCGRVKSRPAVPWADDRGACANSGGADCLRAQLATANDAHGKTVRAIGEALGLSPVLYTDPPAYLAAVREVRSQLATVTRERNALRATHAQIAAVMACDPADGDDLAEAVRLCVRERDAYAGVVEAARLFRESPGVILTASSRSGAAVEALFAALAKVRP